MKLRKKPLGFALACILPLCVISSAGREEVDPRAPNPPVDAASTATSSVEPWVTKVFLTIAHSSLPDYVRQADAISVIQIERTVPVSSADGLGYTDIEARVLSSLKGTPTSRIILRVVGVQGHTIAPQSPRFDLGDSVLVFLRYEPTLERWGIMGLQQGTYPITVDRSGRVTVSGLHTNGIEDLFVLEQRIAEHL